MPERTAPGLALTAPSLQQRRESVAPLSSSQSRLWFLNQMRPEGTEFNLQICLLLRGDLDIQALRTALNSVAQRQAQLRTVISLNARGLPIQSALPGYGLPLVEVDAPPAHSARDRALALAAAELAIPFDLENGPPIRARLAEVGSAAHVLVVTAHHITFDGWSSGIFMTELEQSYNASVTGGTAQFTSLPVSYTDYCWWERETLLAEEPRLVKHWRNQLEDCAELELPSAVDSFGSGGVVDLTRFVVEDSTTKRLQALARSANTTLFAVVLAAWETVLHRYSGQTSFVVGIPTAGRRSDKLAGLVGCFVNTLCVPVRLRPSFPFLRLVDEVRRTLSMAIDHEELPFDRLVRALREQQSSVRRPIYRAYCAYLDTGAPDVFLHRLQTELLEIDRSQSDFELNATFWLESSSTLHVQVTHNREIFDAEVAEGIARSLSRVLDWAAVRPELALEDIPLLLPQERRRLLRTMERERPI